MASDPKKSNLSKGRASSGLKEALMRHEKKKTSRIKANKLEYMDGMQESLNKEIQASINPYWRNHASLKGKKTQLVTVLIIIYYNSLHCRMDIHELPNDGDQPIAQKALGKEAWTSGVSVAVYSRSTR